MTLFRITRDTRECGARTSVQHTIAEVGVTYISTLLDLGHLDDDTCLQCHVCRAARHVSGLRDHGGLVERLNQLLVRAMSLYLLETKGMDPEKIVKAGNSGRLWQQCDEIYPCL